MESVDLYRESDGVVAAEPGVAEKGMLNVQIEVTARGGHSMMPPRHTVRTP